MWRELTNAERESILNKLKRESKPFNLMFLLFALVTILVSGLLFTGDFESIVAFLGLLLFTINFGQKAKKYDRDLKFIEKENNIKICKTKILNKRVAFSGRTSGTYYYVAVKLEYLGEMKDVELLTGHDLNISDYIYVVSNIPNGNYIKLYTIDDVENNN